MTPPVFAHGQLRLYLLHLLAERPMHGYELIHELESRFGGTYTPSAGTIYPRLAKLQEEGLVTRGDPDGRKSVYEITPAGRAEVAARAAEIEEIENGVADSVRRIADEVRASVDQAMRSLRADLAATRTQPRRGPASAAAGAGAATSAAGGSGRTSATSASGSQRTLDEAEAMLTTFRTDLRSLLWRHARRGGSLPAEAVDALRSGLTRVEAEVRAALGDDGR